jgi:L-malate glycosyltransferase
MPVIVHVASGREWRGGQRQVWLLARELARLQVQQVVVTGAGTELARRLQDSKVRVRTARWRISLDPRVIRPILLELRGRNAILHAHDAHALTLAGACAALTGVSLVATRRVIFPIRHRLFWNRAQRVIAISDAVRESLEAGGVSSGHIVVLPDAIDLEELRAVHPAGVPSLPFPPGGRLAVTLGSLTPEKDHRTLIAAAAILARVLPDLRWAVVGEGPLRSELQRQITTLGLTERFHLVGDLPDPHLLLDQADVFVLSSTAEGLGSSILAAMARGVPVVATRVGGVARLLDGGAGLLVPPGNAGELAEAVRRVLTEPDLRGSLVQTACGEIIHYSSSGMAERVLSVYRSFAHSLDGS